MSKQIEKARAYIEARKAKSPFLLGGYKFLQEFSEAGDGGEGGNTGDDETDDEDEDSDEDPSLDDLMKDPKIKAQFDSKFKEAFDKRLKGLDLKAARKALKAQQEAEQKATKDKEDQDDKTANDEATKKAIKFEEKAKRLAVKEYAVDNDLNPRLLARLVDLSAIEVDEDGDIDPDDLEEAVEELTKEFPELFRKKAQEDDDEDQADDEEDKSRSHKVSKTRKKSNNPKGADLADIGKNIALERAKRKGRL